MFRFVGGVRVVKRFCQNEVGFARKSHAEVLIVDSLDFGNPLVSENAVLGERNVGCGNVLFEFRNAAILALVSDRLVALRPGGNFEVISVLAVRVYASAT